MHTRDACLSDTVKQHHQTIGFYLSSDPRVNQVINQISITLSERYSKMESKIVEK